MRLIVIILFFLCRATSIQGQDNFISREKIFTESLFTARPNHGLVARYGYGFLIAHRPNIRHLNQSHLQSFELSYEARLNGNKDWHRTYNFPLWGISLYSSGLGNNDVLGNTFAVFPYLKFPLNKNRWLFSTIGSGIGYSSKIFDRESNYKNLAIGTHFNTAIRLGLEARIPLGSRWMFLPSLNITHLSNASFQLPNLGTNVATVSLGINHLFRASRKLENESGEPILKTTPAGSFFTINGNFGIHEVQPPGGKKYVAYTLQSLFGKRKTAKSSLGAGLDIFNITALRSQLEQQGEAKGLAHLQGGIKGHYSLHLNHLSMYLEMGVYILSKYKGDGMLYHRVGMRHFIKEKWYANLSLKTHFAKAHHFELGMGYFIKK